MVLLKDNCMRIEVKFAIITCSMFIGAKRHSECQGAKRAYGNCVRSSTDPILHIRFSLQPSAMQLHTVQKKSAWLHFTALNGAAFPKAVTLLSVREGRTSHFQIKKLSFRLYISTRYVTNFIDITDFYLYLFICLSRI